MLTSKKATQLRVAFFDVNILVMNAFLLHLLQPRAHYVSIPSTEKTATKKSIIFSRNGAILIVIDALSGFLVARATVRKIL